MAIPKFLIDIFPKEHKIFLENFFRNCPKEVYEQIIVREFPKQHPLISTHEDMRYVFILLKGKLQAIEERIVLVSYQFTELEAVDIVGDYEVFHETQGHYVTLTTLEPSLTLQLPAKTYEHWMRQDANALFMRTQMLMQVLNKQTQQQRQFLFMDTTQRLLFYLYDKTCSHPMSFPYKFTMTREQISAHIGCSVRQLNRILAQLEHSSTVQITHGKIIISRLQYQTIAKMVEEFQ